ncbi:unnamed protein product [Heligmosomoides polygyrus]|uniref:Neur_chan_LBD domain-containing protein n=1 Tax=Heligmosomoides polygyrus TaxID=6339 RepID=A0A3P7Y4V1_HELPZ|nr:unnamed protein product [Heligmosomoides polygyrus]
MPTLNSADPTNILDRIMFRYDKRVRPNADTHHPVIIHMTIVLGILTEVRENQQVASFVISHVQRWQDPKLQWDPSKFNGLKQVVMPQSLVWVPKLFIYNRGLKAVQDFRFVTYPTKRLTASDIVLDKFTADPPLTRDDVTTAVISGGVVTETYCVIPH